MLIELLVTHLEVHQSLFSTASIPVSRITGERDGVSPDQVTATALLRLLVEEEATSLQARTITKNTLDRIVLGPKETIAAEAYRLSDGFRASAVSRYRSHATEKLLFWEYI